MAQCFVIQPFDRGAFDARYRQVFKPAIEGAGLEPYRVDEDLSASIPINTIEKEIRRASICLAEITTDNPNVWFELGFAIAIPKDVVLVCAEDRGRRFPFDVQHRHIIQYKTESPQDFADLQQKISDRLRVLVDNQAKITAISKILCETLEGSLLTKWPSLFRSRSPH